MSVAIHLAWMAVGRLLASVLRGPAGHVVVNISLSDRLVLAVVPLLGPALTGEGCGDPRPCLVRSQRSQRSTKTAEEP